MASRLSTSSFKSARHTVILHVNSAENLHLSMSTSSYCKVHIEETTTAAPMSRMSSFLSKKKHEDPPGFYTKTTTSEHRTVAVWNEQLEIPVDSIGHQVLVIRVKNCSKVYSPSIGAFEIPLKQIVDANATKPQAFPLLKGTIQVGTIRLQIGLRENNQTQHCDDLKTRGSLVLSSASHTSHDVSNRRLEAEADEQRASQRVVAKQMVMRPPMPAKHEVEKTRAISPEKGANAASAATNRGEVNALQPRATTATPSANVAYACDHEGSAESGSVNATISTQKCASGSLDNQQQSDNIRVAESPRHSRESRCEPTTRRSTLVLSGQVDAIVDKQWSSDMDAELDTDGEHELVQQMAALKLQLLQRQKRRRATVSGRPGLEEVGESKKERRKTRVASTRLSDDNEQPCGSLATKLGSGLAKAAEMLSQSSDANSSNKLRRKTITRLFVDSDASSSDDERPQRKSKKSERRSVRHSDDTIAGKVGDGLMKAATFLGHSADTSKSNQHRKSLARLSVSDASSSGDERHRRQSKTRKSKNNQYSSSEDEEAEPKGKSSTLGKVVRTTIKAAKVVSVLGHLAS